MTTTGARNTETPYLHCIRISIFLGIATLVALLAAVLSNAPAWVYVGVALIGFAALGYEMNRADHCKD